MGVADLAAALRAALDELARLRARVADSVTTIAKARNRIVTLSIGSQQPALERAANNFTTSIATLRDADALTAGAVADVEAYLRSLGVGMPEQPPVAAGPPGATGSAIERSALDDTLRARYVKE